MKTILMALLAASSLSAMAVKAESWEATVRRADGSEMLIGTYTSLQKCEDRLEYWIAQSKTRVVSPKCTRVK